MIPRGCKNKGLFVTTCAHCIKPLVFDFCQRKQTWFSKFKIGWFEPLEKFSNITLCLYSSLIITLLVTLRDKEARSLLQLLRTKKTWTALLLAFVWTTAPITSKTVWSFVEWNFLVSCSFTLSIFMLQICYSVKKSGCSTYQCLRKCGCIEKIGYFLLATTRRAPSFSEITQNSGPFREKSPDATNFISNWHGFLVNENLLT